MCMSELCLGLQLINKHPKKKSTGPFISMWILGHSLVDTDASFASLHVVVMATVCLHVVFMATICFIFPVSHK